MNTKTNSESAAGAPKRDWFGYIFTTLVGIIATLAVAWYQLYATQRDAVAAEIERARSVRQVAVAIVEEHVLNGKRLEIERLSRLIDQRRRDELITLPIPVTEVVELAEFSISSSRHLSVARKEEMKPIFDEFYSEQNSRAFSSSKNGGSSAPLINEIAKKIQDGKAADALANLKYLEEVHSRELLEASSRANPSFLEVLAGVVESPKKLALLVGVMIANILAMQVVLSYVRRRAQVRTLRDPSIWGR